MLAEETSLEVVTGAAVVVLVVEFKEALVVGAVENVSEDVVFCKVEVESVAEATNSEEEELVD